MSDDDDDVGSAVRGAVEAACYAAYDIERMNMTWHYQLMRHTEPDGEVWYGVHEKYGSSGYTLEPVRVLGEDKEDIEWMLKQVLEDIEKHGVKDYE